MATVRRLASLPAFLLPFVGACGASENHAYDFSAFDQAVEDFVLAHGLEGATAAIVHEDDGLVHLEGYGTFDSGRTILIASTGKVLSSGVLLRLADDGLLDLDASITTVLGPAWGEHKADITTAQLLSNSAGLVGLLDDAGYLPYLCQFLNNGTLRECAEAIYTADDLADRVPPDTAFRYGGAQWQLAGGIAEVASGKTWAQLIQEIYVEPCGLTSTGFNNHFLRATLEDASGSLAYPTFFNGDLNALDPTENPNIEGGAYSTAPDYAELLLMHLRGGSCGEERVLSPMAVARMQEDRIGAVYGGSTIDPTMPGYGMGWWVSRTEPLVSDPGAYGAISWLDLERRFGVVVLLEDDGQGFSFLQEAQPILAEAFSTAAPRRWED